MLIFEWAGLVKIDTHVWERAVTDRAPGRVPQGEGRSHYIVPLTP